MSSLLSERMSAVAGWLLLLLVVSGEAVNVARSIDKYTSTNEYHETFGSPQNKRAEASSTFDLKEDISYDQNFMQNTTPLNGTTMVVLTAKPVDVVTLIHGRIHDQIQMNTLLNTPASSINSATSMMEVKDYIESNDAWNNNNSYSPMHLEDKTTPLNAATMVVLTAKPVDVVALFHGRINDQDSIVNVMNTTASTNAGATLTTLAKESIEINDAWNDTKWFSPMHLEDKTTPLNAATMVVLTAKPVDVVALFNIGVKSHADDVAEAMRKTKFFIGEGERCEKSNELENILIQCLKNCHIGQCKIAVHVGGKLTTNIPTNTCPKRKNSQSQSQHTHQHDTTTTTNKRQKPDEEWDVHLKRVTDLETTFVGPVHNEEWRAKLDGYQTVTEARPGTTANGKTFAWRTHSITHTKTNDAQRYMRAKFNTKLRGGYTVVTGGTTPSPLFKNVQETRAKKIAKDLATAAEQAQTKADFAGEDDEDDEDDASTAPIFQDSGSKDYVGELVDMHIHDPMYYATDADLIRLSSETAAKLKAKGSKDYTVYVGMFLFSCLFPFFLFFCFFVLFFVYYIRNYMVLLLADN